MLHAGLNKQHRHVLVLAEARRDDRAGGATANDNVWILKNCSDGQQMNSATASEADAQS